MGAATRRVKQSKTLESVGKRDDPPPAFGVRAIMVTAPRRGTCQVRSRPSVRHALASECDASRCAEDERPLFLLHCSWLSCFAFWQYLRAFMPHHFRYAAPSGRLTFWSDSNLNPRLSARSCALLAPSRSPPAASRPIPGDLTPCFHAGWAVPAGCPQIAPMNAGYTVSGNHRALSSTPGALGCGLAQGRAIPHIAAAGCGGRSQSGGCQSRRTVSGR
jgi:hypothetical protein